MGDNRPYTEIGWKGILFRWLLVPISFQLWFIFTLFVYNVMYPFIRLMVLKLPWVWFAITFFLWFTLFNVRYIEGQGLFFFSLGIWLQKRQINIEKEPRWFSLGLAWIFFLGTCLVKTFIAFEFEPNTLATIWTLSIIYNLAVISGVIAVWFSVDRLAAWWMSHEMLKDSAAYSFFIYGFHIPLLAYVMKMVLIVFLLYHGTLCHYCFLHSNCYCFKKISSPVLPSTHRWQGVLSQRNTYSCYCQPRTTILTLY
jgi:Acyltransferase family